MTTANGVFIEPLDVLFLRGNKLFGDPGSYGEALIPPWPSVLAGALRSRILVNDGVDLVAFGDGKINHPLLGTPAVPGSFRVNTFCLARRQQQGQTELLMPVPADLVLSESNEDQLSNVKVLIPQNCLQHGLMSSASSPLLPVLAETQREKPSSGYWLTGAGWERYLAGRTPESNQFVKTNDLWTLDHRVGVGLETTTGSAAQGKLFSVQAVALRAGIGFFANLKGAIPPQTGMLRFGGDGRAAVMSADSTALPAPDYSAIIKAGRCRLIITSPAIFPQGSLLSGCNAAGEFALQGISGRLVCSAAPRVEVVSGWDLANKKPKPAQRVVPAGAVYWLDQLQGTPEALHNLVETGLWCDPCEDLQRQAEGFNRCSVAQWMAQNT